MLKNSLLKPPKRPQLGLAGEYRFVVRRASDHAIVRETDWFSNLILDAGLNRLGSGTWRGYAHIGTGTAAPAVGDTTLANFAAATGVEQTISSSNSGSPDYYTTFTVVYRFAAGALNGNYTEVGVGWTNSLLFSRALIVDGGGSPTSITVTSAEYLDVYYRLRMVPDLSDSTYGTTIGGVSYTVTRRASSVSNYLDWQPSSGPWCPATSGGTTVIAYNGTLGPVTGFPSGSSAQIFTDASLNAYSNNSYTRTGSLSFGLGDLNVSGGIKSIMVSDTPGSWQHEFNNVIPKDSTKVMSLNFTMSWGRV